MPISRHYAVNACLAPLYSVEGMHIITVEGVGNRKIGLHPIQVRMLIFKCYTFIMCSFFGVDTAYYDCCHRYFG
jgi:xanthine dehydrogenase iron-sulfur cluster and FAD-binding subunit A